jgi:hypothetical protein
MFVLVSLLPLAKETTHLLGKTHVTNPVYKMNTCTLKARELKPYMKEMHVRPVPTQLLAGTQDILSSS